MSFGLTPNGFVRKRLPDIQAEIIDSLETVFGPINRNADAVIIQFIGIMAEREALLWEELEGVYEGLYPASAEGVQLDRVANLKSLTRIAAAESTAVLAATGTAATVIPLGNQFSASSSGDVFESDAAVTIQQSDCIRMVIEVDGVDDSQLYRITIGSTNYDYTSDASATAQEIIDGLIAALSSGSAPMTGVDDGTGTTFTITSNDNESGYSITLSTGGGTASLAVDSIASPVAVTAQNTGEVQVSAGIIDTIVNPVSGLASVTNIGDGVQGRDTETDAELRVRIQTAILGAATVEAIRTRILNEVSGVSTVLVTENREDIVVGGLEPHSILVVVQGGDDQDIADKIWEVKPAGIETNGTESETVVDSMGTNQTIKFSRPTSQYAWVRPTLTLTSEESVGSGAEDAIKAAILEYGNSLGIGDNLFWQRHLGPIFSATPGIESIVMELAVTSTPGGTPSYLTDTDVAIAFDELAVYDLSRITIVGL